METKVEGARNLAFLLSEANGNRSRETVTIASGEGVIEPGTVLGEITASEKYAVSPHAVVAGKEGAETATAVLCYGVDATDTDVTAVVVGGDAEVKTPMLIYHPSVDDSTKETAKKTQLRSVGVKAR